MKGKLLVTMSLNESRLKRRSFNISKHYLELTRCGNNVFPFQKILFFCFICLQLLLHIQNFPNSSDFTKGLFFLLDSTGFHKNILTLVSTSLPV